MTNVNIGCEGQNALVAFEGPIKQSSLIRELNRLVSHQIVSNVECTEIIVGQQQNDLYEDRDEEYN